jgi:hypothetical protein
MAAQLLMCPCANLRPGEHRNTAARCTPFTHIAIYLYRLVQRALEIAAAESGLTMAQLKALPIGRARRSRHDDTTAVVMFF